MFIPWHGFPERQAFNRLMLTRKDSHAPASGLTSHIKAWRELRGLTLEQLGEEIGKSHASLSRIENGVQNTTEAVLSQIAAALSISVIDLVVGPQTDAEKGLIPIVSWVSAGTFQRDDFAQDILGTVKAPDLPPGDWIALRVEGDSMDRISPPGSIIFVDRSDTKLVPNACYIIVDENGCATYKRYRSGPHRFEPVSVSRDHETLFVDGDRWPTIAGRVKKSVIEM